MGQIENLQVFVILENSIVQDLHKYCSNNSIMIICIFTGGMNYLLKYCNNRNNTYKIIA